VINNVIRLLIFSPPFSFRQSKTDRLFQGGGSRLRYWLCPSLLSAHLYESELLSLYLGLRLCSLADSILIVLIAARAYARWHTFAVSWVLRACCYLAKFAEFPFHARG
jgi:hypothetical protein